MRLCPPCFEFVGAAFSRVLNSRCRLGDACGARGDPTCLRLVRIPKGGPRHIRRRRLLGRKPNPDQPHGRIEHRIRSAPRQAIVAAPMSVRPAGRVVAFILRRTLRGTTIFARDHLSQRIFADIGLHARVAPDLALRAPSLAGAERRSPGRRIGWAPRTFARDHSTPWSDADAVEELRPLLNEGFEVVLLTQCSSATADDGPAVARIAQLMPEAVVLPVPKALSEARDQYASLDVLIGGRMHAAIGAIRAGTPALAVAYEEKVIGLFDDQGLTDFVVADARGLGDRVRSAISRAPTLSADWTLLDAAVAPAAGGRSETSAANREVGAGHQMPSLQTHLRDRLISASIVFRGAFAAVGMGYECNICRWRGHTFLLTGHGATRRHAMCPRCRSLERHRLAYKLLGTRIRAGQRTLHVAPEPAVSRWLRPLSSDYLSISIDGSHAMAAMDLTRLPISDGSSLSFTAPMCSSTFPMTLRSNARNAPRSCRRRAGDSHRSCTRFDHRRGSNGH